MVSHALAELARRVNNIDNNSNNSNKLIDWCLSCRFVEYSGISINDVCATADGHKTLCFHWLEQGAVVMPVLCPCSLLAVTHSALTGQPAQCQI